MSYCSHNANDFLLVASGFCTLYMLQFTQTGPGLLILSMIEYRGNLKQ